MLTAPRVARILQPLLMFTGQEADGERIRGWVELQPDAAAKWESPGVQSLHVAPRSALIQGKSLVTVAEGPGNQGLVSH